MELIDGVGRNAENPNTFDIPSQYEIDSLKEGDFVKLGFINEDDGGPSGERMWVKFGEKVEGVFRGTLHNVPAFLGMKYGDPIVFEARHILATMDQAEVND